MKILRVIKPTSLKHTTRHTFRLSSTHLFSTIEWSSSAHGISVSLIPMPEKSCYCCLSFLPSRLQPQFAIPRHPQIGWLVWQLFWSFLLYACRRSRFFSFDTASLSISEAHRQFTGNVYPGAWNYSNFPHIRVKVTKTIRQAFSLACLALRLLKSAQNQATSPWYIRAKIHLDLLRNMMSQATQSQLIRRRVLAFRLAQLSSSTIRLHLICTNTTTGLPAFLHPWPRAPFLGFCIHNCHLTSVGSVGKKGTLKYQLLGSPSLGPIIISNIQPFA